MMLEGTVRNGVIVPDQTIPLSEGSRVRIEPLPDEQAKTFGERFGAFVIDDPEAPTDLASQHDHYRLGVPKR